MILRHRGNPQNALAGLSGAGTRTLFDGLEAYAQAEMRGFGVFDPAVSAVGVIAKVRLAYGAGGALQAIIPLDFKDLIAKSNPLTRLFPPEILVSPSKGALAKSYKDLGALIDDWAGRKYQWASQGKRDDGTPYSWARWADLGKTYMDTILYQSALPVTDGFAANAVTSIAEFINSLRTVFTPTEWPTWAKVAAGLAGVAAVAYVVNTVRGPLR
jgi:hypothetical protein